MAIKKLKIGLLLDSYNVQAWIHHAIERITRSGFVEITLIILNGAASKTALTKSQGRGKRIPSFIYQVLNSLDEKIFVRRSNALKMKDLHELLKGIPVLLSNTVRDSEFEIYSSENIEQIQNAQLDILVKFGFDQLKGHILSAAKYGVWTYHFGDEGSLDDEYAGYWEVIKNKPVTTAALYTLKTDSDLNNILYRSQIATHRLSPARNRNSILWFASAFMVRQMELLQYLGIDRFLEATSRYNATPENNDARQAKPPTDWDALKGAFRLLWRILHELTQRLFYKDSWFLLFDFRDPPSFDSRALNKLLPPADRFWADPFIVQGSENYFIFVEEFSYSRKKGHISVIELDPLGNPKESIPILDKSYHLSYPCIIQHNHNYFMVPESAANKTIDLYECEEFPTRWNFRMTLMEGVNAVDPTLFYYRGKWWIFTGIREKAGVYPDVELFLFFADDLFTREWQSHPLNPVVSDVTNARPAGQVFLKDGKIYRPSQNCTEIYGHNITINEITCLSETDYQEQKTSVVLPDWDRKVKATHTFNNCGQLTVIDAYFRKMKLPR
jgi:hypothetical protein